MADHRSSWGMGRRSGAGGGVFRASPCESARCLLSICRAKTIPSMKYVILAAVLALSSVWTRHDAAGAEPGSGRDTAKAVRAAEESPPPGGAPCPEKAAGFISAPSIPVSRLMGMRVTNPLDEDIGEITDIILDRRGCATRMVIRVGGFMGIGGRRVTLSLDKLRIRSLDTTTGPRAIVFETRAHILRRHADRKSGNGGN